MCKADKRRCAKSQTIRRSNVLLKIRNLIFPKKELILGGALALALVGALGSAPQSTLAEDLNKNSWVVEDYVPYVVDPKPNNYNISNLTISGGVLHIEDANSFHASKLNMVNNNGNWSYPWLYVDANETSVNNATISGSMFYVNNSAANIGNVVLDSTKEYKLNPETSKTETYHTASGLYVLGSDMSIDNITASNYSYAMVLGNASPKLSVKRNDKGEPTTLTVDWSDKQEKTASIDILGSASFSYIQNGTFSDEDWAAYFNEATHVTFGNGASLNVVDNAKAFLLGKNDFQGNNVVTVSNGGKLYVGADASGAQYEESTEYGDNVEFKINNGTILGLASNLNVQTTFESDKAVLYLQKNKIVAHGGVNQNEKQKTSDKPTLKPINENLYIPDPNGEYDVNLTWEGRIKSIDDAYYGSSDSPSQVFNKSLISKKEGDGKIVLRTFDAGTQENNIPGEKLSADAYVVVFDDPNAEGNFKSFSGTVDVETGVFTVNGDTVFGKEKTDASEFKLSAQNLVHIQEKVVFDENDKPEYKEDAPNFYDVDKEGTLAFRRGENAVNGATLNMGKIEIGTDRTLRSDYDYVVDRSKYYDGENLDHLKATEAFTLYATTEDGKLDVKTNGANVWIDTRGAGTDANLGAINANTLTIANDTNFWLDDISTKKSDNSLTFGLNVTDGKVTMKTYTEYENYKTYIDKTPVPDRSTGKDENGETVYTEDFKKYAGEYGAVRAVGGNELADADKTPDANGYYATAGWFNQELNLSDTDDVNTFLDHTFGQAALVNATYDDASKTVTINAKNMLDFANEPGRNVNGNDIKYAKGMDEMRVLATTDDKYYKMYEALWNEKDPYKVEQALKNLAGLNYMMLNSYSHYGSITSSFFGGSTTSGLQRRGQSAHERMDEPLQESAISQPEQEDDLKRAIWASYVYATVNGYDYMEGGSKITGYDMRRQGIIGGIRKQFNGSTSGGLFFGLTNPQADARDSFASGEGTFRTKMEMDDFQFAGHMEKTFFDTMELSVFVGGGHQSMDWNRWVNHNAAGLYSFTSDGTGNTMTGTLYLAQRIDLNENWKLRPLIGIDSEHSWIYGYDEREGARGNDKKLGLSTTAMLTDPFHYSNVYYNRNTGRIGATISYSSPDENAGISGRISYGTQLGGKPAPIYNVKSLRSALELNDLEGHKMGTDSFSAGAGGFINLNPTKTLTASGEINGIWYKNATTLNATGGLYYRF